MFVVRGREPVGRADTFCIAPPYVDVMEFIDTHCHLDFDQYDDDREQVLERCADEMAKVINIGTDAEHNMNSLALAREHDVVAATMGLHPSYIQEIENDEPDTVEEQIRKHQDDIVAIGEIGLDYHHAREEVWREKQAELFHRFLALAEELQLPVILHTRDAEKQAADIVADFDVPVVVQHCFNGAPVLAEECVDREAYISVSTQVLYSNRVQDIAATVPLEYMLLETDAPFLYQGERNAPWYVKESAEQIADIKAVELAEVAARTTENARNVFDL